MTAIRVISILILTLSLIGCGPSEKEVALKDGISALNEERDELKNQLSSLEEELEYILNTPVGMLCNARLVLPSERINEANERELIEAERVYKEVLENYPDTEVSKEASNVYKKIREERATREVTAETEKLGEVKSATDYTLINSEKSLNIIIKDYEDTEAITKADRFLKGIQIEWSRRGKPVEAKEFVKNEAIYVGETVRVNGNLEEVAGSQGFMTQFRFEGTDRGVVWLGTELLGAKFVYDIEKAYLFQVYAHQGSFGAMVFDVVDVELYRIKKVTINDDVFEW